MAVEYNIQNRKVVEQSIALVGLGYATYCSLAKVTVGVLLLTDIIDEQEAETLAPCRFDLELEEAHRRIARRQQNPEPRPFPSPQFDPRRPDERTRPDEDEQPKRHVALGIQDGVPSMLTQFTFNLNEIYNPQNITVHAFDERHNISPGNIRVFAGWYEVGLSPVPVFSGNLNETFLPALNSAEWIHFNLEGIVGDYMTFVKKYGGKGNFRSPGILFSAVELFIISSNPDLCAKTFFYEQGSVFPPIVSLSASIDICGFIPIMDMP